MLLAEKAVEVVAEDVMWAARSATFALIPLGWLPFFGPHFPSKLKEVLECVANGREGGNLAVTPGQEDILSTTGAERAAARVNHQLVLQELVSAISVRLSIYLGLFSQIFVALLFAGSETALQATLCV